MLQLSNQDEEFFLRSMTRTEISESALEYERTPEWGTAAGARLVLFRIIAARENWTKKKTRDAMLKTYVDAKPGASLLDFTPGSNEATLGTPEEFLERWRRGEAEVFWRLLQHKKRKSIRGLVIRIGLYSIPPDEPDEEEPTSSGGRKERHR